MRYLSVLAAIATAIGVAAVANVASAQTSYEVTVTNNMSEEFLAPILVAPVSEDAKIFVESYVTPEAENQILTGDPAMLAEAIGASATVGHGMDGPPGVLLAPGNSVTFTISTDASEVRILAMVAPTMYLDHYVTAVVTLGGEAMSVALDRFDIGHDEMRMSGIQPVAVETEIATVTIGRM